MCEQYLLSLSRPLRYKTFSCSTQLSMKFFLLINVKMPTIVGILTFMCRKNNILSFSEPEIKLNFLIFSYLWAFKFSCLAELSLKIFFYNLDARFFWLADSKNAIVLHNYPIKAPCVAGYNLETTILATGFPLMNPNWHVTSNWRWTDVDVTSHRHHSTWFRHDVPAETSLELMPSSADERLTSSCRDVKLKSWLQNNLTWHHNVRTTSRYGYGRLLSSRMTTTL